MEGYEYLITIILISAFLGATNAMSKKAVPRGIAGKYHLRLTSIYKWVGYASSILGFVIFVAMLYYDQEESTWEIILGILVFLIPGEIILMWYFNHQVIFDQETIIVISWTGKTKQTSWKEIDKIKYNPILGYLQLYAGAKKLNIHYHVSGLLQFLWLMERKTEYKAADLKIPI